MAAKYIMPRLPCLFPLSVGWSHSAASSGTVKLEAVATVGKELRGCSKFKARPVHITGGDDWESIQQKRIAKKGQQRPGPQKSSIVVSSVLSISMAHVFHYIGLHHGNAV